MQSGLVRIDSVKSLLASDRYRDLLKASESFAENCSLHLKAYQQHWGLEMMKNWSRQYEYPFVDHEIERFIPKNLDVKVLDAGSGCSFFPFFQCEKHENLQLTCTDYDQSLAAPYSKIQFGGYDRVEFQPGDLRQLNYEDQSFDGAYCISVLEHTDSYEQVLQEFHRVLKPNGFLVLTIDIAPNGDNEIPPDEAEKLLGLASKYFSPQFKNQPLQEELKTSANMVFTTRWAHDNNFGTLPWRFRTLSAIKASLIRGRLATFPNLAFYCGTWIKN